MTTKQAAKSLRRLYDASRATVDTLNQEHGRIGVREDLNDAIELQQKCLPDALLALDVLSKRFP